MLCNAEYHLVEEESCIALIENITISACSKQRTSRRSEIRDGVGTFFRRASELRERDNRNSVPWRAVLSRVRFVKFLLSVFNAPDTAYQLKIVYHITISTRFAPACAFRANFGNGNSGVSSIYKGADNMFSQSLRQSATSPARRAVLLILASEAMMHG